MPALWIIAGLLVVDTVALVAYYYGKFVGRSEASRERLNRVEDRVDSRP